MPLENFLPGAGGGGVDESKTYLIKGSTLKELLKKTDFAEQDFVVQDKGDSRTVALQKKPEPTDSSGTSLQFTINDCEGNEIATLIFENGKLLSPSGTLYLQAGCDGGGSYWS